MASEDVDEDESFVDHPIAALATQDETRLLKLRSTLSAYKYRGDTSPTKRPSSRHATPHLQRFVSTLGRSAETSPDRREEDTKYAVDAAGTRPSFVNNTLATSAVDSPPSTPRKAQKRAKSRGYAPPEKYEHLHYLQDHLEPYQKVVFCGINPGFQSGQTGYHYAHSTNHFWRCLHLSGLTERLISPAEGYLLPELYGFGLQSELCAKEMKNGVPILMDKLVKYRPHTVCFLGRGIWDVFRQQAFKLKHTTPRSSPDSLPQPRSAETGLRPPDHVHVSSSVSSRHFCSLITEKKQETASRNSFKWGLQPFKIVYRQIGDRPSAVTETFIFVAPSPSARVSAYQWWDKVELFKQLRNHLDAVQENTVDSSAFTHIPLTTTKSIYFISQPE
ncbi:uracil-DNA glycosylase-like protein [Cytidiella melzeri]|nr:uracil-DNA glycosylase-like protein [Cytidiella melzeri]